MDYASSNSEKRAHELLLNLAGACPESVWENISIELETKRKEAEGKWAMKIANMPKMPLVVAGVVIIITASAWMVVNYVSKHAEKSVMNKTEAPVVDIKPVANNTAPVQVSVPVVNNNSVQQPTADNQSPQPFAQNIGGTIAKNDKKLDKQQVTNNVTPAQTKANADKDDGKPILINKDGDQNVVSGDAPVGKGVAIDLDSQDTSSVKRSMNAAAVETTVKDTAQ